MKKIGILTHPLRTNYGGVIQNYALQSAIKSLGYDVQTIDWQDDKSIVYILSSWVKRNFFHYVLRRKEIPTNLFLNLTRGQFIYISSNIQKFINNRISLSAHISMKKNISRINDWNYDALIVGSDQVWLKSFVPMMFLDFIRNDKIRKIAYAASFGKDEWTYSEELTNVCSKYAKRFNAISVREESAIALCDKYLSVKAEHVLDPTMLLSKEDYSELIGEDKGDLGAYLMTYILDRSTEKTKISNEVKEYFQLRQLTFDNNSEIWRPFRDNSDLIVKPIESWLKGFRDSSFIVTDSFHGVVFSIIFNKQFIAIGNNRRGMSRFTSILNLFELEDRLITIDVDIVDYLKNIKKIDYEKVNVRLKEHRIKSLEFLSNNL